MILDTLEHAETYFKLHPRFEEAFKFLRRPDLAGLDAAAHPIDKKEVYALIQNNAGKEKKDARLEAHRSYIDIQFLIAGSEQIGWKPREACGDVAQAYDGERDIEFFSDPPQTDLHLKPGMFAIFFPGDAHAPMVSEGVVHKCVVKVKAG